MTQPDSGSLTVQTAAAADALLDLRTARILAVFWQEARTVTEAARQLGQDPEELRYRVRRLTALGLLQHTETQARKGRPMKRYRVVAQAYFVPFEVTRHETLEAYLAQIEGEAAAFVRRNLTWALQRNGEGWGLRLARGEDGEIHSKLALSPNEDWGMTESGPALLSFVYPALKLDLREAKAFQRDLLALFRQYAGKPGAQTYLCQMVLCPVNLP
ncbi:hypothetical protein [Deinococcus hopiensis]|uniref:Uncharacterized protein n=1 Tax=Deinococcus hopiensis KR-140 TaxID=695939 RepID=A0A1W1UY28_9DEIO|nr:hypothetical protein [Deinococcus hopiensis]SMB86025.1 hypothetical protein SAMN00790413_03648 [Deinococcus hopiensis KR-140]